MESAGGNVDGGGQAADGHRLQALGGAVVAQLAAKVKAPTLHAAARENGATVAIPRTDTDGGGQAADCFRRCTVRGGGVPELPVRVAAPALDGAGG